MPELEKERDKLLHVAELLEADSGLYKVDPNEWEGCWRCSLYARRSRMFEAMATRIRRFWGSAFQHVPTPELRDLVRDSIAVLNMTRIGQRYYRLSNDMQQLSMIRELLALRAENAELRKALEQPRNNA